MGISIKNKYKTTNYSLKCAINDQKRVKSGKGFNKNLRETRKNVGSSTSNRKQEIFKYRRDCIMEAVKIFYEIRNRFIRGNREVSELSIQVGLQQIQMVNLNTKGAMNHMNGKVIGSISVVCK